MNPLRRKIEDRSITALQLVIDSHPTMEGYINKRDKELSWDVYIRLYQWNESMSDKSNYDDDVQIQIKGHVDKDNKYMCKERIMSPVNIEDLAVYYRKYGCLYFVMYMTEDGSEVEIFYASLYPSKIKSYLEKAKKKGNKSSISIPFIRLPKDGYELYRLCKQFSFEIRKQGSGLGQIVPRSIEGKDFEHVKTITATTIGGKTPYDLLKKINTGDAVFYGEVDDSGIQYPMQISEMVARVKQTVETPIYVDKKMYYSTYEMEITVTGPDVKNYINEETITIKPSENLRIILCGSSVTFKFELNTDINQLRRDSEFILASLDKMELSLNNTRITVSKPKLDGSFVDKLRGIIDGGQALEDIGLNVLIPFKELTDTDRAQIDFLCAIKAGQIHFETEQSTFQYIWTFREKVWPIIVDTTEKKIKISSCVFSTEICTFYSSTPMQNDDVTDNPYPVPNYIFLSPEILANLYFYDFESMYEQIDRTIFNETTSNILNELGLNLISSYDICRKKPLLDIAAEVFNRLFELFPSDVCFYVNLCQVEIRKNGIISEEGIKKLKSFYPVVDALPNQKNTEQVDVKNVFYYCAEVLKGNISKANEYYSKLTEIDKKCVDGYPIRTLHLNADSIFQR